MTDRNLPVIGCQSAAHRGGRIALHDNALGLRFIQCLADPGQQPAGKIIKALIGLHQIKIEIGPNISDLQNLIEHFSVLGGYAGQCFQTGARRQGLNDRKKLDCFRSGAKNGQYFRFYGHLCCHSGCLVTFG